MQVLLEHYPRVLAELIVSYIDAYDALNFVIKNAYATTISSDHYFYVISGGKLYVYDMLTWNIVYNIKILEDMSSKSWNIVMLEKHIVMRHMGYVWFTNRMGKSYKRLHVPDSGWIKSISTASPDWLLVVMEGCIVIYREVSIEYYIVCKPTSAVFIKNTCYVLEEDDNKYVLTTYCIDRSLKWGMLNVIYERSSTTHIMETDQRTRCFGLLSFRPSIPVLVIGYSGRKADNIDIWIGEEKAYTYNISINNTVQCNEDEIWLVGKDQIYILTEKGIVKQIATGGKRLAVSPDKRYFACINNNECKVYHNSVVDLYNGPLRRNTVFSVTSRCIIC